MNRRIGGAMCVGAAVAFLDNGQPWWHQLLVITLLVAAFYLIVPDGAK